MNDPAGPALLVNIDVDDLPKAIRFYCEAFGLRVGRRFGEHVTELLGSSAPIYLLAKPSGSIAVPTSTQGRDYSRHWTPVHLDFVVQDIERAADHAVKAGAKQEAPTRTSNWGRLALMSDPFGNGFCLVQFLGRGYDEIATSEAEALPAAASL
jgi:predicted enzyme related to lactoylglutathione lyase